MRLLSFTPQPKLIILMSYSTTKLKLPISCIYAIECFVLIYSVLGHVILRLQGLGSEGSPSQLSPPYSAAGLAHVLVRVSVPSRPQE